MPKMLRRLRVHGKKIRLSARTIVIFLKYFDATRQSLTGSAEIYIRRTSKVRNLIPIINRRMRWPSETLLKLYVVTNGAYSFNVIC